MLEVKILKLRHMGRDAAVMLRPHIRECDIVSPEAAGLSAHGADNFEKEWANLLGLSRTAFRSHLVVPKNEYEAFIREFQESAHYEKKPVHILERFSETGSARIKAMAERFIGPHSLSFLQRAVQGEEEAVGVLRSNLVDYIQSLLLRDQEIGSNLTIAESEIRRKFPSLRSRDKIRLTVYVGGYHFPEIHTPIKTEVVELPNQRTETDLLIKRLYSSGDWAHISDEDIRLLAGYTIHNKL